MVILESQEQELLPAQEELQELTFLASERNEGWQGGESPFKLPSQSLCNLPIPFSTDAPRNACAVTGLVSLPQARHSCPLRGSLGVCFTAGGRNPAQGLSWVSQHGEDT